MFIPRGKIVYDNLATSYVRVDALAADLCEGGFSGVVEVLLRATDSFVVINNGIVAAVVEKRVLDRNVAQTSAGNRPHQTPQAEDRATVGGLQSEKDAFTGTTLEKLAERSRLERGRVSIYSYSAATAGAVAGRINAQSLYVGLNTQPRELEKMISKLAREQDREWFIEINTEGVPISLIHMRDGDCRILNSAGGSPEETVDAQGFVNGGANNSASNSALGKLLYECNRPGTTFDVYIGRAAEAGEAAAGGAGVETQPISGFRYLDMLENGAGTNTAEAIGERVHDESPATSGTTLTDAAWDLTPLDLSEGDSVPLEPVETLYNVRAAAANYPAFETAAEAKPANDEAVSPDSAWNLIEVNSLDSSLASEDPADGEAMAEAKRLMGEIARTIEEAAQAVDRPESFSMSLRAGQIKVADRFPFLDPFASEIEYLSGEIVFVGQATVEEFVAGLTEALKLAVEAVMKATAYPDRFRAYVIEDLSNLLARERPALHRFGLDKMIEDMTGGPAADRRQMTDDRRRKADDRRRKTRDG